MIVINSQPEQVWSISSRLFHTIIEEPDPRLKVVCDPLTEAEIAHMVNNPLHIFDMLTLMGFKNGIGLAAPQIGITKRYFVMASTVCPIMINPVILERAGEQYEEEGCLSLPGVLYRKKRAYNVMVGYTDMQGIKQTAQAEGLMAICVQHEIDHLDGILFTDGLSPLKKQRIKKKRSKYIYV